MSRHYPRLFEPEGVRERATQPAPPLQRGVSGPGSGRGQVGRAYEAHPGQATSAAGRRRPTRRLPPTTRRRVRESQSPSRCTTARPESSRSPSRPWSQSPASHSDRTTRPTCSAARRWAPSPRRRCDGGQGGHDRQPCLWLTPCGSARPRPNRPRTRSARPRRCLAGWVRRPPGRARPAPRRGSPPYPGRSRLRPG